MAYMEVVVGRELCLINGFQINRSSSYWCHLHYNWSKQNCSSNQNKVANSPLLISFAGAI
jgi:hypothetical protein